MRTWNDYKDYVKNIDDASRQEMESIEEISSLITSIIKQRTALGLSQRDLAELCGMPQSSVARIEAFKTTPKLDTLLKITHSLGLKFSLAPIAG